MMMMAGPGEGPRAAMLEGCRGVPWGDGDFRGGWGGGGEKEFKPWGEKSYSGDG